MTPRRLSSICPVTAIALGAPLPAGASAGGGSARVWLTTGDRADLLAEQPSDALGAPTPDAPTISVEPGGADASRYLAGTAFHCYFGDPERQSALHDLFPQKDIYFTERSGTLSGDPATTFPDTLHWHTRFLTVGAVRNWAKTVITWNLALDPCGGPHNGGCGPHRLDGRR
jgi:hypothetical protein